MNLLLLKPDELKNGRALLSDKRAQHIIKIIKAKTGDTLHAGLLHGLIGKAHILDITSEGVTVEFTALTDPPAPADLSLVLALPRPKAFRRILFAAVACGVKDIHIINSWRVEKSYWESPYMSHESVERISMDALSQSKDTVMPQVSFHRYFMQFMGETLELLPEHRQRLVAHPYGAKSEELSASCVIAVGPEGGFVEREMETFEKYGFKAFSPIERVLTTEHFVPFILGKLII
ncbi:MAG: 16S rRNA (uracil(1498)-N(3))-methyltransferase [Denitrovibrio sp.]|nr:MAG: 16S rRNA (uracil(1498)-N(3))-methyltransferase [Denitrovibrio sp.]